MDRVYTNSGNSPLIALLGGGCARVLDVGCGAGDNAALIARRFPGCRVDGITHSHAEAALARSRMANCWVLNIEDEIPAEIRANSYDALIFSHVLEHLRDPAQTVASYSGLLSGAGVLLIAVPNVVSWRMRLQILAGDFTYTDMGPLDSTHLRFFTFHTADKFLLAASPNLQMRSKKAHGSFPLWWLRRHLLPAAFCDRIDAAACRVWPNLFGEQVILEVAKL
jgi:2-polyprenyl-3-methyl-5-hydroxy-6-metoxy-1,4-benzoquinol methylase